MTDDKISVGCAGLTWAFLAGRLPSAAYLALYLCVLIPTIDASAPRACVGVLANSGFLAHVIITIFLLAGATDRSSSQGRSQLPPNRAWLALLLCGTSGQPAPLMRHVAAFSLVALDSQPLGLRGRSLRVRTLSGALRVALLRAWQAQTGF